MMMRTNLSNNTQIRNGIVKSSNIPIPMRAHILTLSMFNVRVLDPAFGAEIFTPNRGVSSSAAILLFILLNKVP